MARHQILSPDEWDKHIKAEDMPDTYIDLLLTKISEVKSAKITIVFSDGPAGTRYDIHTPSKQVSENEFHLKSQYIKIAKQYVGK